MVKYGTAGGVIAFIRRAMPYENPGSLSELQYNQIVAYLLVQNGLISPVIAWENLPGMQLS